MQTYSRRRFIVTPLLISGTMFLSFLIYLGFAGSHRDGETGRTAKPLLATRFFKLGPAAEGESERRPKPLSRVLLSGRAGTARADVGRARAHWPNVMINPPQDLEPEGLVGDAEPSITVAADGRRLLAAWNNTDGFRRPPFGDASGEPGLSAFGYSTDGGAHWVGGGAPTVFENAMTGGDTSLDSGGYDRETFYLADLAFDATDPNAPVTLGIGVRRGHFWGGFTWQDMHLLKSPDYPQDSYDKPAIAADKDGGGAAYVSLTNFRGICGQTGFGFGRIELWRTRDAGDTWHGPLVLAPDENFVTDPNDPMCGAAGILQHNSAVAVTPEHEACVVWTRGPIFTPNGGKPVADIMLACTEGGGRRLKTPQRVAHINSLAGSPPAAFDRSVMSDVPQIAVVEGGPHKGRIYVVFYSATRGVWPPATEQSPVSSQVFLSYSDDGGRTFSRPTAVGPPVPDEGVKRFWPSVVLTPDGAVNVTYYESLERQVTAAPDDVECKALLEGGPEHRTGLVSSLVDVMIARSTNGGMTFAAPRRVSAATSNWCRAVSNGFPRFGDYITATANGSHVLSTWTDTRNGWPDIFFADVNFGASVTETAPGL